MHLHHFHNFYNIIKNQWQTPAQLEKIRVRKLRSLIRHAYQKVPYYRELFDSIKLDPRDIKRSEDIKVVPATSRESFHDLKLSQKIANDIDPNKCKTLSTSGTTGVPLKIFKSLNDATLMNLAWGRVFLASGMKPWHKMMAIIGHKNINDQKSWYEYFGLWQRKEISIWSRPQNWIKEIRKWKPHVLIGYEMNLKKLAETIQEHGIKDISPKLIFHSSGLLDDFSRQFIESAFRTRIVDIYGSEEAGCIAWECAACKAYHICADMVIVEILKNGRCVSPGDKGEVVITNLHSYAMPFIRYQQGDVAVLSPQKSVCGRSLPLLERIEGRTDDFIILNNGEKISPHPFYHCICPVSGVRKWRIVQEKINRLCVEIEPGTDFGNDTVEIIRSNLLDLVKHHLNVDIVCTDKIPVNPSSKFRSVESRIHRSGQ